MNKFLVACVALVVVLLIMVARPPLASPPEKDEGVNLIDPPDLCSGYPISITKSGSYKLQHDIDLAKIFCDKTAIEVNADDVTIDLNGHTIKGPCEALVCVTATTSDGHHGIDATDHNNPSASGHNATTVKNGTVTLMGDDGVHLGNDGIIEYVRAINNEGEGIQCGEGCLVSNDLANGNGGDGFEVDDSSLVKNVVGQGNGGHGITCDSNTQVSVIDSVFLPNTLAGIATCKDTSGNTF